jgi:mono/diheme cytochrome c family protein
VKWSHHFDSKSAHSGERFVRVEAQQPVDSSIFCEVTIKPNTEYRLAAWIKAKGLKGKLSLNDHIGRAETEKITRNGDWQLVETTFHSGERLKASINILFVGSGEGSFDDVSLTELIPILEPSLLAGDALRGEKIFRQHQTAACVLCHALGGQGSAVGPALDGIASRQNSQYIRQSLVEPNAVLAKGYENLGTSPMPPMNLILTAQELEDIQAFLQTLK